MAQQQEDWSKYEVKETSTPPQDDWSQYEVKKKVSAPASKSGGVPSNNGLNRSQGSLTDITPSNQNFDYAPLTPQARVQQEEKDTQIRTARDAEQKRISKQLSKVMSALPQEARDRVAQVAAYTTAHPDKLSAPTQEELDHERVMNSTIGKILAPVAYLGSKATKGTLQIAKGAAWLADNTIGAGSDKKLGDQLDKLDPYTNMGLTKSDEANLIGGKGGHLLETAGAVSEFLPAIYTGGVTNKAATFALQGFGAMKEVADKAEQQSGVKLKPIVKNGLIAAGGAVNAVLMGDIGSIFNKLPAGLRADITAKISADAIKQAAGKELTGAAFRELLEQGAKSFEDKVAKFGIGYLEKTAKAAIDLSALNTANFTIKKAADKLNDAPVFNENLGQLASSVSDIVTKEAPLFGAAGSLGELGKLTPYSNYKNSVVESLMADPSEANINKVKEDLYNIGFSEGSQWSPEEMDATFKQLDNIAQIAAKLPRNIKPSKLVDAVDILSGREELNNRLQAVTEARTGLDEAVSSIPSAEEKMLQAKIDQANDKLQNIVGGVRPTFGKDKETGKYFKNVDGKVEEITKERYDLERLERDARQRDKEPEQSVNQPANEIATDEQLTEIDNQISQATGRDKLRLKLEYERVEKLLEKQERDSVFQAPLDKVLDVIDGLIDKNKKQPNGYGAFIENADARESKSIIKKYTEQRSEISDNEIKSDFKNALLGRPETWYADGLKLRESANLAAERGIDINDLLANIEKEFIEDGYSANEAKTVIANRLKSIIKDGETSDSNNVSKVQRLEQPTGTNVGQSEPITEPIAETTTLRNADVDARRKEYGFDEAIQPERKPNTELVKEADSEIQKGYDAHELMDKVINDKHVPTDVESVILAKFQGTKEAQLLDVNERIAKATTDANTDAFNRLVKERDDVLSDLQRSYDASKAGGTAAGRALQARQVAIVRDYSLANLLIRKRASNGGAPLSQEQITRVTEQYNDLKAKSDAYEAKIKELEAKNESLLSEQATARLKKLQERTVKRTAKVEDLDKDIEASKAALKKIVRKSLGNLSANPLPVEFVAELGNLVKLYAQKGIVKLTDVVDNIYNDLKNDIEGLEKADILEAIGNIPEEQNSSTDPLRAAKSRMQTSLNRVREKTVNRDFSKKPRVQIQLDEEGLKLRDALEQARRDYEIESYKEELRNRPRGKKILDGFTEIVNTPRALLASTDFSAPLRQGLVLTVSHPITASKAFVNMFKVAFNKNAFDRWFYDLKEAPDYEKIKESKLYISDPNRPELAAKEEEFMSNLAEKIPLIGKLVSGSERAYVGYLNKLRVDIFRQSAEMFEQQGLTFENSPETYKGLAKWVNNATGRGDFKNENLAQTLNLVMFSPRLIAARINLTGLTGWYRTLPKEVRKMAYADMAKTFAAGATVLALAKVNGLQTEIDPRSADFGKIRSGNRRWDIWGGFSQYYRFLAQELSGETKSTTTGKISKLNGKKFGSRTRLGVAATFFRNKLAPVPALMLNALDGKDAMGNEFNAKEAAIKNIVPLTIQDSYQAIRDEGLSGAFKVGLPTTFGVGVQTYDSKKKK